MTHWGVDSSAFKVDVPLSTQRDPQRRTLYDFVTAQVQAPAFWGRYLKSGPNQLSQSEVGYLRARRCRIVPIFNVSRASLSGPGALNAGRADAQDAIVLAQQFGIPARVRIYADLERWRVDPAWFRGWCEGMFASQYAGMGGFCGNPQVPNLPTEGWAGRMDAGSATVAGGAFATLIGNLASGRPAGKPANMFVWSNRPLLGQPRTDLPPGRVIPNSFRAAPVGPLALLADTVIWQYHMNTHLGSGHAPGSHGIVDLDLATDRGYAEMWQP
jgi:hypothetical protein